MPRNQNGVYFLPDGNPVAPGELVTAEWANSTLEDLANAMTDSLDREGLGGMRGPLRNADGKTSNPSVTFTNEPSTGLYRKGEGVVGVTVKGQDVAEFNANGITMAAGKSVTLPDAPSSSNQAANKKYVDDAIAAIPAPPSPDLSVHVKQTSITGAMITPHGKASERPTNPTPYAIRGNEDANTPEYFDPVSGDWTTLGVPPVPKTVDVSFIIIGGGGVTGNGSVGGGEVRIGEYTFSTRTTISVGAVGGSSSAFGITAAAGQAGSNAGQVHWGWDASTNCDAWPGGPGGGLNGAAGTPGGGPSAGEYNADGGNGGNGVIWSINGQVYAGGQGGYRDGAGTGVSGSNGTGWGNFGGGNHAGGVIVSYVSATQRLDGGTVTQVGGRFYHTFSSTADLSLIA